MANMFALILALATLITGIIWCFERFKWAPARREKTAAGNVDDNELVNVAKPPPGWVENGASVFPVLLLVFVVRSFIYEPFQIPSGSMMPTLLIGDFILVEKYAYGIKDPITQTTLIKTGHPKRGDIAVFKYPLNPKLDYIKRVIGLPGDRITYDPMNKRVAVQPSCDGGQSCDKMLAVTYNDVQPSDFVQLFSRSGVSEASNGFYQIPLSDNVPQNGIRLRGGQETLGNVTHSILSVPGTRDQVVAYYQQPGKPLAEWVVPAGHYFMMGDNRDNSADSRYWGFVPEKNLVGKATAIWMSFEKQEGEWPTGLRLSRIGAIH
ncbi:signal peptidase I [Serratia symbiotica]|uniref:signal peptidase I n=1 Tax=Serratia symbiotica TaxID=138074 RepID=UPI00135F1F48|nr:signal peptidase I [Serratia symbiotica]MBQ0957173.1 signal peptidase I [Serratia symbiotica]